MKLVFPLVVSALMGLSFCSDASDDPSKGDFREDGHVIPPKVLIQKVEIQSILPVQEKTAHLLFDMNPLSFWAAENPSSGVGKYFEISFSDEILFNRIVIQQGAKIFHRVKKVLLLHEGQSSQTKGKKTIYLTDKDNSQTIRYDSFITAKKITIYIQEVYPKKGMKSNAAALAEIAFFYDNERVKLTASTKLKKKPIQESHQTASLPIDITPLRVKEALAGSSKHITGSHLKHKGQNLIDGNPKTSWIEGHPGDGTNEYIQFDLTEKAFTLKGLSIINGYAASTKQFKQYNRVKKMSVEVGIESPEGTNYLPEKVFTLIDKPDLQFIPLDIKVATGKKFNRKVFITLTIHSLYYGRRSKETALSEITFYKPKSRTF